MALYTDLFPYAIVVPVMPFALKERAGVPHEDVQSWIAISLATFGASILVFSPVWGYLADRTQNRRTPMMAGLLLLGASTLLLTFMHNFAMMVAGRVFQGMTAALTWSVGLALIVDTVSPGILGQVMGWVGVVTTWAELSAPLLGGVTFSRGGWYSVWGMCLGLILVDILLRAVIIEKKDAKNIDTSEGNRTDDEKRLPATEHHDQPPEPTRTKKVGTKNIKRLFKNPRLLAALWGCIIESTVPTAFDAVLPLEVEKLFGWGSFEAGFIFAPFVIPIFFAPIFGWLADRHGPKWFTAVGFFVATPFLACLRLVTEDTWAHKALLCGLLAGAGLGFSSTMGPLMAEITWSIKVDKEMSDDEPEPIALAYALYSVAFSAGTILGPLLAGYLRKSAGWGAVGPTLAALTLFTGVTSILWIGGSLKRDRNSVSHAEGVEEAEVKGHGDGLR
ncbi:major facilitator superfamily protein [Hirsutella rhossiliensis]|uniref:Major facilitator superfamily domain-containing protein n=1 Tax=Hirsutella rhossiliensis TaxID=111463 RepID=A0A9P8SLI0_9HYPO|nr:major facilitator superfamily domain-containing protein [Hirsutella rhossiliensis]KAH0967503.1 major facilitator superfamily domain-containing protein [Hirsutella rhossiliensis]